MLTLKIGSSLHLEINKMRIVYTRIDGVVCIVNAAPKIDLEKVLGKLTQEQYEAHVWSKSIPENAINAIYIPDDMILPDREFRDAWTHDGKEFSHDFPKAKNIQLERVRKIRDALLIKYDGLQNRANDLGDNAALNELKIKKQELRDCTNALKDLTPTSIEHIKNATPDLSNYSDAK
jgi:hypothetical protein